MERVGAKSIKELIEQSIEKNNLNDGIDKVRVKKIWAQLTGEYIANSTSNIYVYDSKLFVSVNSSIIRNEILLIKSELKKRINKEIGRDFIKEIIVR